MKKSSLNIIGTHYKGSVIRCHHSAGTQYFKAGDDINEYQFSVKERAYWHPDEDGSWYGSAVVVTDISPKNEIVGFPIKPPEVRELAMRFARLEVLPENISENQTSNDIKEIRRAKLKTIEKINAFAGECGLLLAVDDVFPSIYWGQKGAYVEPISLWLEHIRKVRYLLEIYSALHKRRLGYKPPIEVRKKRKGGGEEGLIRYGEPYGSKQLGGNIRNIQTADGENTSVKYIGNEPPDEETAAVWTLAQQVKEMLLGGINVGFDRPVPTLGADPTGFRLIETRETPYLLAAIYYDLWEMITESRPVRRCKLKSCSMPIEKSGRREFCNNACKQKFYNENKKTEEGKQNGR